MGRKNRRKKIHAKRLPTLRQIQHERMRMEQPSEAVNPKRMEIWFAKLPFRDDSSVQGGSRPVLIISNDIANGQASTVTVLPMTSRIKKMCMPTHVLLGKEEVDRRKDSVVLAEQITTLDKTSLMHKISTLNNAESVRRVEDAVREQLSINENEKEKTENEDHHM